MKNQMTGGLCMLALLVVLLAAPVAVGHFLMEKSAPEVHASLAQ